MSGNAFHFYAGDGTTIAARGQSLRPFERIDSLDDPANYIAGKGLVDAVNVALALGQPLLVTGEPGTGKTQLAASIAFELGLPSPFVFHIKTTSTARDLFYRYDSLRHFHDAQFSKEELPIESYVAYEALGLAVLLSMSQAEADPYLPKHLKGKGPQRSVVLIDEVDKAPRDLPNDVLDEVEQLSFTVKETGRTFRAEEAYKPILVLTSNSEKNLPDAFLRRCVFYHIPFPEKQRLKEIVQRRLSLNAQFTPALLDRALEHFEQIRELSLKKKPATAELLSWLRVLDKTPLNLNDLQPGQFEALAFTYAILAKTNEDKEMIIRHMRAER